MKTAFLVIGGLILAVLLAAFLIFFLNIFALLLAILTFSMMIVLLVIAIVTIRAVPYYFLKKRPNVKSYGNYELEEFEDSKDRK
ncbi:MAG: hypothetical protein ACLFSM_08970 [Thermoplasmata archaeon]